MLGVPGLMRAYRAGSVAIVNAVGTGVADDKAIYHYVPEMIRYYLGEEPIVENVPTYLMSDREQREWVLERLDQVVVKPTSESGGKGVFIGPTRDRARSWRAQAEEIKRMPETLDRAGPRAPLDRPDRRPGRRARRRATSTCARSRSSATTSRSCPAGSRAWRCARAR